ncbi:helix-turn-helix domain-containing protein [Nocardia sp. NPDC058640]|uniref:helix-turn-helix domain-containing protein n=1 Tax=Nocardia sp. NPDC058640 TaxID=3346571 RepID=UPI00366907C3
MTTSPPTDRVVSIVELLATKAPMNAAAIADALDLSRSTVGAILTTLQSHNWVQRSHDLTYRLGPAFPHHNARSTNPAALPSGAQDELRALAQRVGCGAALAAVTPTAMTFVAIATPDRPSSTTHDASSSAGHGRAIPGGISSAMNDGRASALDRASTGVGAGHGRIPTGIEVGTRLPLRAPAAAAVVAFSPPDQQRAWLDTADPTQRRELATALTEIQSTGAAVWGIDPTDLGTLDILAEVAGHLAHSPATGPLRRRVLGLLAGLSGYPHTTADLAEDQPLPIAYLAAPVFDADRIPRWELQIGPLHPAVSLSGRDHYRTELLAAATRLSTPPS